MRNAIVPGSAPALRSVGSTSRWPSGAPRARHVENSTGLRPHFFQPESGGINHRGHREHRGRMNESESSWIVLCGSPLSETALVNPVNPVLLSKKLFSGSAQPAGARAGAPEGGPAPRDHGAAAPSTPSSFPQGRGRSPSCPKLQARGGDAAFYNCIL